MGAVDVRRLVVPGGLAAAGLILLVIGGATGTDPLVGFGAVGLAVGGIVAYRIAFPAVEVPAEPRSVVLVSDGERRARLEERLAREVARSAGRVESVTPYSAVVVTGRPVNHVLHLLASVFLCGLWLPVWVLIAVSGGERRWVLSVDPCGNVTTR